RLLERLAAGEASIDGLGEELAVPEGVGDPGGRSGILLVAGIADQRPSGAMWLAEVVVDWAADETLLLTAPVHAFGEVGRDLIERPEVVAFEVRTNRRHVLD